MFFLLTKSSFLIKHAFQMLHRAASFLNHSVFQCSFILAKKERAQPRSQNFCKTTGLIEILMYCTGYIVRILLCSKVDNLISWVCEIDHNGNLKAGRLNRIPVALQTNGLKLWKFFSDTFNQKKFES